MQDKNGDQYFQTKDISIAAFLLCCNNITLVSKTRLANNDIVFNFSPKIESEILESSYWNFAAPSIQPRKLFSSQRDVKDMIFGGI